MSLLKNKLWAYPTPAGVFTLFVIYEVYSLVLAIALFGIFTIFDALVVILILHEYQQMKKLLQSPNLFIPFLPFCARSR